ncbi:hypothetical protein ACI2IX_04170 [Leifsonia aquatica]|uniref:hypothetical protein n=1 Tax=Leifsonia aquatica TaxID=144185 RepID=UPI00384DFB3E
MSDALAVPSFIFGVLAFIVGAGALIFAWRANVHAKRGNDLSNQQLELARDAVPAAKIEFLFDEGDQRTSGSGATYDPGTYICSGVTILNRGTSDVWNLKAYASTVEGEEAFQTRRLLAMSEENGWVVVVPVNRVRFRQVAGNRILNRINDDMAPLNTQLRVTYTLPGSDALLSSSFDLAFRANA